MTDEEVTKIALILSDALATKEDLKDLATKEDLRVLATKEDLNVVRLELKGVVKEEVKRLEVKIDELDKKADVILNYADNISETVDDHEKRLKRIESLPIIASE